MWCESFVLYSCLSFVGYSSVAVHPNELNVMTFMPPKMVANMTPSFSLVMNGMPNTDKPERIKLRA